MTFWQLIQRFLGLQVIHLDQPTLHELQNLAEQENRPKEAVAADLLSFALVQRGAAETKLRRWQELSPREREVTALVCLSYTNRQIATHLSLSLPTVKTHVRNVLRKFGLSRRSDLRLVLAEWDFSAWDTGPG
jgi:DNA-binding CsgD family transcriptional regulator